MANTKLTFPKAVEVAPGMFRSPQPVSKAAQPPTTDASTSPYKEDVKDVNQLVNSVLQKQQEEPSPIVQEEPAVPSEMDGLVAHAKLVRMELLQKWSGKGGVNPHIWVKENIDPLLERVKNGEKSDELKKKLIKLSSDIKPVVNVAVVDKTK